MYNVSQRASVLETPSDRQGLIYNTVGFFFMTGTDGYHDNPGIADAVDFLCDRKSMDYLCDRHKDYQRQSICQCRKYSNTRGIGIGNPRDARYVRAPATLHGGGVSVTSSQHPHTTSSSVRQHNHVVIRSLLVKRLLVKRVGVSIQ